jgi:hypothetical protein
MQDTSVVDRLFLAMAKGNANAGMGSAMALMAAGGGGEEDHRVRMGGLSDDTELDMAGRRGQDDAGGGVFAG